MRRTAALALGALALTGWGCGRGDDPPPPRPAVLTVVQDDAELLHRSTSRTRATLDDLRALGVDWVRVTAGWSVIAPPDGPPEDPADPASYPRGAWKRLDRLDRMTRARGMRLAVDVAFWAPRWAVDRPVAGSDRQRDGIDARAFAAFATAVARRYPRSAAFTVWNEPNHPMFLLPQWRRRDGRWVPASPHRYRRMLQAAVPAIRRAARGSLVLVGGLSSVGASEGTGRGERMAPMVFLRELACVDRSLRPLRTPECRGFRAVPGDGWAHHPYSLALRPDEPDPDPDHARMGDLGRLAGLLDRLHAAGRIDRRPGLYLTEHGFQTYPPDPTAPWTVQQQAALLPVAEQVARREPRVRSVAQFLVRDLPARPGRTPRERWRDFQSGLRFADGRAKPAHAAFALPLVARAAAEGRLDVWGLVRPGRGRRSFRVTTSAAGGRIVLASGQTRPDGTFRTEVRAGEGAHLRAEALIDGRWRAGAPTRPYSFGMRIQSAR